jgi:hypothetical protein
MLLLTVSIILIQLAFDSGYDEKNGLGLSVPLTVIENILVFLSINRAHRLVMH